MKNFFIIYNKTNKRSSQVAELLDEMIKSKGCNSNLNPKAPVSPPYLYTDPALVPIDTDCIISVGGDGTLIRAARDTVALKLPIIGINTGHLGFLAEIEQDGIDEALDGLINDRAEIEERTRLELKISRGVGDAISDSALNDVVLLRNGFSGILGINLYVDGQHLNSYNADGIIISTPTGSTGYSLSAGGPIMDPTSDMILITPINPHTTNSRSIVLSAASSIEVSLNERSFETDSYGVIICDGECIGELNKDVRLQVIKSEKATKIAKLNKLSFIKLLRNKMKDE